VSDALPRALTLLVVDDDPEMRRYVQRSLERGLHATGRVHLAADGEEALALIARLPIDLVITDVLLPRLDGLSLCAAIHDAPATRTLPVLIVSGELEAMERAQSLVRDRRDLGFLPKPFNGASLCAAVVRLLGPAAGA
jgi:CheY-like chemotaxis protein